jgi:O-antigen/teichoic acid export membrane protein
MSLGNGVRLVFQALYFVLMARSLGPRQYGMFAAVVAAVAIVSPFVGNGFSSLMIRRVARDRTEFAEAFGNLLFVTLFSGLLLSVLLAPACRVLLPRAIPSLVIAMVIISDLLVFPYVAAAGVAFWSLERLGWTAALNVFASCARLIGIVAIVAAHGPTVMAWSVAYLVTAALASLTAIGCALRLLGLPKLSILRIRRDLREGCTFSVGLSAQTIYNDIDKTMLARLGTLDGAGIYAAAYRLIDVAFVPVSALLSAAYPGFFRHGRKGIHATIQYGSGLLKHIMPYSLCIFAALIVCAPVVPWILGREYREVAEALRWLAVLPVLKTLHYFCADSLTGAGYQVYRTIIQVSVALFNILVNIRIIPAYGWRGAAWSSIATDGLLAVTLWLTAAYLARSSQVRADDSSHVSDASCIQI